MKAAFALAVVVSFGAGVLVRDVAQEWKDEGARAALREDIRKCQGSGRDMVLRANAAPACIAMMPRFDADWPIKPNPVKLTRKDIRNAVRP